LALRDDEGRGKLRKFTGRCKRSIIRECPNGATHADEVCKNSREPPELKHLSRERKRKQ